MIKKNVTRIRSLWAISILAILIIFPTIIYASRSQLEIHPKLGVLKRGYLMVKVVTKEKENIVYKEPSTNSQKIETVDPLTIFFVFPATTGKAELMKNNFYHISRSPNKEDLLGWIHKDYAQEWYHREFAKFASLTGRDQALVFKEKKDLITSLTKKNRELDLKTAISREPADSSSQRQDVLLPILDQQSINIGGQLFQAFHIAYLHQSGVQGSGKPQGTPIDLSTANDGEPLVIDKKDSQVMDTLNSFKLDIMFVLDMTRSMQPVIDNSVQVIQHLTEIAKTLREGGGIRVGLVGYRDRIADQRKMGFIFKQFSPLTENFQDFIKTIKRVHEAKISSEDYPEAMFDGLLFAINNTQWSEKGLKVIVLIGDAAGHEPGHPKNPENISAEQILQLAGSKKIRICALKMITGGNSDHHRKQLKKLFQGQGPGTKGTYGEFDGKTPRGINNFVVDTKALLTNEADTLQQLLAAHMTRAQNPSLSGIGRSIQNDKDYIILENINESAIKALRKQGKNPDEPIFSTGWIAAKQDDNDIILPHVFMSDQELLVLSIYLRGISNATSSKDIWDTMIQSIERITGENTSIEKNMRVSDILQKKHGIPVKTKLLRFTIEEMREWSDTIRKEVIEQVKPKIGLIDSIANDPDMFLRPSNKFSYAYVPLNYLP